MNKLQLFKVFISTIILVFLSTYAKAQETVVFSVNNLANGKIESRAGSMNGSWLLDSDVYRPRNTSNEERWAEMKIGAVRYPYGMGENYLWDTPPYGSSPLVPKVATMDKHPGVWSWATNSDRTLKNSMDFDEFMAICQRQHIKPLVVISTQGHKYPNGPSYQELKTTAVEWVKYAKKKGYKVAYWQLGNEVDHHSELLPEEDYFALYEDFVTAMKKEDPTIACGLGILRRPTYLKALLQRVPDLVDFTSVHQYLFNKPITDYETWLNHDGSNLQTNITGIQRAVNNSSKPNLPILVTETNAFGNWKTAKGKKDSGMAMYKGLTWFDMLMTQQSYEDVVYSFVWNSHSTWNGENGNGGVANALTNDKDNAITPIGMPIKILNTTAEERYMIPDNKVHGATYSYGTFTPSTGKSTIYLLNKSKDQVSMTVNIDNYTMSNSYERWVWAPTKNEYSVSSTFTQTGNIVQHEGGFTTNVPASSVVVVKLKPLYQSFINVGANLKLKSNLKNTDVISAPIKDKKWLGNWQFVTCEDGYVYIKNRVNGLRLHCSSKALGVQSSVKLLVGTFESDWAKWKLIPVGSNWYIQNKSHNVKLAINDKGEITVDSITSTDKKTEWKLGNEALNYKEFSVKSFAPKKTTNVSVSEGLTFTFSEAINLETAKKCNVYINKELAKDSYLWTLKDSKTLQLNPKSKWTAGSLITVLFNPSITSASGSNYGGANYEYEFIVDTKADFGFERIEIPTLVKRNKGKHNIPMLVALPKDRSNKVPVQFWVHGGGWSGGTATASKIYPGPNSEYLAEELGVATIEVAYRCKGSDGTFAQAMEDLDAAYKWAVNNAIKYNLDLSNSFFSGGSAGTPLSSMAAQRYPNIKAYVGFNGIFNFVENLGPFGRKNSYKQRVPSPEANSAIYNLRENPPITLLLHGDADTTIHYTQSTLFADAIKAIGGNATAIIYEGEEHAFFNSSKVQYEDCLWEVSRFLKGNGITQKIN